MRIHIAPQTLFQLAPPLNFSQVVFQTYSHLCTSFLAPHKLMQNLLIKSSKLVSNYAITCTQQPNFVNHID
ncbi:hypothetical protein HanRHA438_Chr06g0261901 [Helianthus annuus]|nr:hypothetical protein HanRHA438_Chr06g0261901 [Helianthus annuus]